MKKTSEILTLLICLSGLMIIGCQSDDGGGHDPPRLITESLPIIGEGTAGSGLPDDQPGNDPPVAIDADSDGYDVNTDCNDADAAINPGATEVCGDSVDNNCNNTVDEGCNNTVVAFYDPQVEAEVRNILNMPNGDITTADLATITNINLSGSGVTDVTVLQYMTNLQTLQLDNNNVTDISPISGLTELTDIDISNNGISDIAAIGGMNNLQVLNLRDNNITDASDLTGLPNLIDLDLRNNQISDISTLPNLPGIEQLNLRDNNLTDLSGLSNYPALLDLDLRNNNISDVSGIDKLNKLEVLDLKDNQVQDLTDIGNLNSLLDLDLENNSVQDITPLGNLTGVDKMVLRNNQITDVTPLAVNQVFTNGAQLELNQNPLTVDSCTIQIPIIEGTGVSVSSSC